MKKNYTFNIDSKYNDYLKLLKMHDKRSINACLEVVIDYYCLRKRQCSVDDFLSKYDYYQKLSS